MFPELFADHLFCEIWNQEDFYKEWLLGEILLQFFGDAENIERYTKCVICVYRDYGES